MSAQPEAGQTVIVGHIDGADTAWIRQELHARGLPYQVVQTLAGEELPAHPARAVVLGGPMSVYAEAQTPVVARELAWLAAIVDAGVPVLGICLGSQLLAHALGGRAVPGARGLEYGLVEVRRTEAEHPLSDAMSGTYFSFHTDTFEPPPGASLLAVSDRYPQAWSLGSALAVQFHPEISPDGVRQIIGHEGPKLRAAGIDPDAMLAASLAAEGSSRSQAAALIGGWLDLYPTPNP